MRPSAEYARFMLRVWEASANDTTDLDEVRALLDQAKQYSMLGADVERRLAILRARLTPAKEET